MNDYVEMRIGAGKNSAGQKIPGYSARCGKSMGELLREQDTILVTTMGPDACNNAVKALMHANRHLEEYGKHAAIQDVKLRHETIQRKDGIEIDAVLVILTIKCTD